MSVSFFFSERKKTVLVILSRIKGHLYKHPAIGLHTETAQWSSAMGKSMTTIRNDPIRKLSHHKRTVISSTTTEGQKALNNILKVSTHTNKTE